MVEKVEAPTQPVTRRSGTVARFLVLLLALGCSGAAGLTYQVLWLRLLSLVFGVTAYAASTVLAGFMAGLAIGSLVAGRVAARALASVAAVRGAEARDCGHRARHPAASCIDSLPGTDAAHGWIGDEFGVLTAVRFAGALLVLLVPTSMMGATLPLVAASPLVRHRNTASRIGAVYAANTAGAIAGVLVTGLYLIGAIGIRASFRIAAAGNVIAAAIALWLSMREDEPRMPAARRAYPHPPLPCRSWRAARRRGTSSWRSLRTLGSRLARPRSRVVPHPRPVHSGHDLRIHDDAGRGAGRHCGGQLAGRAPAPPRSRLARAPDRVQAATGVVILLSLTVLGWTYGRGWRTSGQIQASVVAILPAAMLMGVAFPIALRMWARFGRSSDGLDDRRLASDLGTAVLGQRAAARSSAHCWEVSSCCRASAAGPA